MKFARWKISKKCNWAYQKLNFLMACDAIRVIEFGCKKLHTAVRWTKKSVFELSLILIATSELSQPTNVTQFSPPCLLNVHLAFPLLSISCVLFTLHTWMNAVGFLWKKSTCSKNTVSWQQSIKLNATDSYSKSNYLYNWRCKKYQFQYLLVRRSWHPNHWAKLDKRGLGIKLDTWRWTWCLFQVDLCSTLFAI